MTATNASNKPSQGDIALKIVGREKFDAKHPAVEEDIVCFSHLRWNFVFQRPQHLLTRFSATRKVYYIEEPVFDENHPEVLAVERKSENLFIVTPHLRHGDHKVTNSKLETLIGVFLLQTVSSRYLFWYYTPMALEFTASFNPVATIYDCMDELSAFHGAPVKMCELEDELLAQADVVFTGGRSIYEAKKRRHNNIYCTPSSIDKEHFLSAREHLEDPEDQKRISRPRFGFFGVVDERFDIELLRYVAESRKDWEFVIIGPVVKIDPAVLPRAKNIHYLGGKNYKELPTYLGNWDVAIMPFAINDSTKYISPTKTPEYLAGGKPVVSTEITDVVFPYEERGLVHIGRTREEFIAACETALKQGSDSVWLARVDDFLSDISWDKTTASMKKNVNLASHHLKKVS